MNDRTALPRASTPLVISGASWALTGVMVCILPSVALWTLGADLTLYSEFPPKTLYVEHAPFAWAWWIFYAVSGVVVLALVGGTLIVSIRAPNRPGLFSLSSLALLCFSWLLAWNRWEWAEDIQQHTFLFVWTSYILLMNALLYEIHGSCPLSSRPSRYLLSFPVSAIFWWAFEFLNRFTQNWQYLNVDNFSPLSYAVFASLSFSTVLPSVWVTKEFFTQTLLSTRAREIAVSVKPIMAWICLVLSALVLILIPFLPNYLFASIWAVPIVLAVSVESLRKPGRFILREVTLWSAAGLWCGFLWELWNVESLAKWIYHVPFVQRFYVFEMPVVGYAGYIPFGVLCGMAIESLRGIGSSKGGENVVVD